VCSAVDDFLQSNESMSPAEFRSLLLSKSVPDIVSEHIIDDSPGAVVSQADLDLIASEARAAFQLASTDSLKPIVVGSAKLGFSIIEKRKKENRPYKPRYRDYVAGRSDIDIAIVSPVLYGKVWSALALYGANQTCFPWRTGDLADYMLHGWIRPDKFPTFQPPIVCSDWTKFMHRLKTSANFRYRGLSCALYHSKSFLSFYQQRGVKDAQITEKLQ
jgi:hypothetical protein